VIEHEETGFIVDVKDVENASRFAIKLLTDEKLFQQFSRSAFQHARTYFHSIKIVQEYEALYNNLLKQTR